MIPLRLVVDTNIVVSAELKPEGQQHTVLLLALTKPARLYLSCPIFEEYKAILARPEFQIRKALRQQFLQLIENCARFVVPCASFGLLQIPATTSSWSARMLLEQTISSPETCATFRASGKEQKLLRPANFSVWWPRISSPEYRKEWAERVGLGFDLPTSEPALKLGYVGYKMRKAESQLDVT